MPGIIPESTAGGIVVRDEFGICLEVPDVSNSYCPPGSFTTSCLVSYLPSDCTARITAAQINAFESELLCFAVALNPDGQWNCGSVCNLSNLFSRWMTDTYPGSLTQIITDMLATLPPPGIPDAPSDGQQYARQSGTWSVVIGGGAGGGIPDAPIDTKLYGRQNGSWVQVPPDPPADGTIYGRQNNAWVPITFPGTYPGEIKTFAMVTPPTGFVKANGAALSRTTYAALFAAIGTTWGAGDGSTTFNVPDLRGEFERGWDDGRGVDAGRVFASFQDDSFRSHTHTGGALADGYHNHAIGAALSGAGPGMIARYSGSVSGTTFYTANNGQHTHDLSINATGGTETRPRNKALLKCIRY